MKRDANIVNGFRRPRRRRKFPRFIDAGVAGRYLALAQSIGIIVCACVCVFSVFNGKGMHSEKSLFNARACTRPRKSERKSESADQMYCATFHLCRETLLVIWQYRPKLSNRCPALSLLPGLSLSLNSNLCLSHSDARFCSENPQREGRPNTNSR